MQAPGIGMALGVARGFFRTLICATPMRRIVAACVFGGAVAGCSIDPLNNDLLTASIAPGTPRKSVCVIAAIGDTFSLQKVGVTAFGNALDKVSVEAWGIDKFVGDKISSQLAQRFDARRLDYPRGAFAFIERTRSPFSGDSKDFREEIRDAARGIVASQRCDLCIVVTKSGGMYSSTNQSMYGLGIVDNSNLILTDNFYLFALWEMRVFDGKTFAVLGHKRAPSSDMPLQSLIRGPYRKVDKSWWPAPAQVAQNAKLRGATLQLLEQSIEAVVAELFMAR
jgi:hypothetical protein